MTFDFEWLKRQARAVRDEKVVKIQKEYQRTLDSIEHVRQMCEGEQDGASSVKNSAAVALGRLGGKKGGLARARKLTPEECSEIARKAAAAR